MQLLSALGDALGAVTEAGPLIDLITLPVSLVKEFDPFVQWVADYALRIEELPKHTGDNLRRICESLSDRNAMHNPESTNPEESLGEMVRRAEFYNLRAAQWWEKQ